jgi:large subunit ribosomal protein L4e
MFAPTKTWRRWHRKVNKNHRRYAICSAIAASAVTGLVMARGHRVDGLNEIPCVIADKTVVDIEKTAQALKILKAIGADADVERCKESKKVRPGKGKMRNRRYIVRKGPLVIYDQKSPMVKAFRNLPGVELCSVERLNLLKLAPGGHVGRLLIWTESAFKKLDALYGSYRKSSSLKVDYKFPRAVMTNASLARIINSDEVQSKVRPARRQARNFIKKKNPLVNRGAMVKLNPYSAVHKKRLVKGAASTIARNQKLAQARKDGKETAGAKRVARSVARRKAAHTEAKGIVDQLRAIAEEDRRFAAVEAKAAADGVQVKEKKKEFGPLKTPTMGRTNFYMRMFY